MSRSSAKIADAATTTMSARRATEAAGPSRARAASRGIGRPPHAGADCIESGEIGRKLAGDASLAHNDDAVAQRDELVEVLGKQQETGAGGARLEKQRPQRA